MQNISRFLSFSGVDEYLAWEEASELRHEYVAGEAYVMTGATTRHNRIAGNAFAALRTSFRRTPCMVFFADVKVRAAADRIYYPDLVIACGKAAQVDVIIDQPTFIVEVTSPKSRATDRREKRDAYCALPSLKGYLIIEQRYRGATLYLRNGDAWTSADLNGGDEVIEVPQLRLRLSLGEVYDGVTMPQLRVGENEEDWGED